MRQRTDCLLPYPRRIFAKWSPSSAAAGLFRRTRSRQSFSRDSTVLFSLVIEPGSATGGETRNRSDRREAQQRVHRRTRRCTPPLLPPSVAAAHLRVRVSSFRFEEDVLVLRIAQHQRGSILLVIEYELEAVLAR